MFHVSMPGELWCCGRGLAGFLGGPSGIAIVGNVAGHRASGAVSQQGVIPVDGAGC